MKKKTGKLGEICNTSAHNHICSHFICSIKPPGQATHSGTGRCVLLTYRHWTTEQQAGGTSSYSLIIGNNNTVLLICCPVASYSLLCKLQADSASEIQKCWCIWVPTASSSSWIFRHNNFESAHCEIINSFQCILRHSYFGFQLRVGVQLRAKLDWRKWFLLYVSVFLLSLNFTPLLNIWW